MASSSTCSEGGTTLPGAGLHASRQGKGPISPKRDFRMSSRTGRPPGADPHAVVMWQPGLAYRVSPRRADSLPKQQ